MAYQYWVDGNLAVADPLTEKILDPNNDKFITSTTFPGLKSYPTAAKGIVSVFEAGSTPYVWKTTSFTRPSPNNLHVYELLIRDFDANRNFQDVINRIQYFWRKECVRHRNCGGCNIGCTYRGPRHISV